MSQTERRIHHEILERIEKSEDEWRAGDKVLDVTIDYKKDAYRNRPRGYYLCLQVATVTDDGSYCVVMSFGDEGDPSKAVLIQETKAFSQKKFDAITITPETLAPYVNEMKAEYRRRRDLELARRKQQQERKQLAAV
jgi:hypothetical protein